jgi:hypothetical protein
VNPVLDPLLFRKSGSAWKRTRDLCVGSQELWPLDHRGGPTSETKPKYPACYTTQSNAYILLLEEPTAFVFEQPWRWMQQVLLKLRFLSTKLPALISQMTAICVINIYDNFVRLLASNWKYECCIWICGRYSPWWTLPSALLSLNQAVGRSPWMGDQPAVGPLPTDTILTAT